VNRYIYRYDFGMWTTGGLADAMDRPVDEVRGAANWDKIPMKEIEFNTADNYYYPTWTPTGSKGLYTLAETGFDVFYTISLSSNVVLNPNDDAYLITLNGAGGKGFGNGATLTFTLDNRALRNTAGFINLFVRRIPDGSIALVLQTTSGYSYIAVAGSGGQGTFNVPGGAAGTILTSGMQGGPGGLPIHSVNGLFGGGGGGRSYAGSTGLPEGPGAPDGGTMTTEYAFLTSGLKTGGTTYSFAGGDGYYGGGSGDNGGGGGGSYVSAFCTEISSSLLTSPLTFLNSNMTVQKLVLDTHVRPAYNIYIWLTTYNMLRIHGGRGALMFQ
jgi:hypothetical protein